MQVGLEPLVLGVERERDRLPPAQSLVLLAQPGVLGADVPEAGGVADGVAQCGERRGQRGVDRRQRVRQRHAGALGEQGVGLAEQHQAERRPISTGRVSFASAWRAWMERRITR